jgi:hypothetical protein
MIEFLSIFFFPSKGIVSMNNVLLLGFPAETPAPSADQQLIDM